MIVKHLLKVPRWVCSAVVIAAVLYLTLVPSPLPENDIPLWEHTDKVVHAIMMLGIWWAVALDWGRGQTIGWRRSVWLTVAVIALGGIIELLQGSMGLGRGASWGDFAADAAGAIIAALTYPYARKI